MRFFLIASLFISLPTWAKDPLAKYVQVRIEARELRDEAPIFSKGSQEVSRPRLALTETGHRAEFSFFYMPGSSGEPAFLRARFTRQDAHGIWRTIGPVVLQVEQFPAFKFSQMDSETRHELRQLALARGGSINYEPTPLPLRGSVFAADESRNISPNESPRFSGTLVIALPPNPDQERLAEFPVQLRVNDDSLGARDGSTHERTYFGVGRRVAIDESERENLNRYRYLGERCSLQVMASEEALEHF